MQKRLNSIGFWPILCLWLIGVPLNAGAVEPNDLCADAIPVAAFSVTPGSTVDATFDNVGFCGTSNSTNGVWYKVVGSGATMTATTCSPNTNYDSKISVFSGSCGTLVCVGGNDDDFTCPNSGLHSRFEWQSVFGVEYFILVHGFATGTGDFDLTLSRDNAAPNCISAVANPNLIWPPNHEMVPVDIVDVKDPDEDPVTITVNGITQNEEVLGRGAGRTAPDATLDPLAVRAERSGGEGSGRIYFIEFTAEDDFGGACEGQVEVCVPDNQNAGGCTGPLYDSTTGEPVP